MFVLLLLLLGVHAEWVEISQQLYLKPISSIEHPHTQIFKITTSKPLRSTVDINKLGYEKAQGNSERITKPNRIYINSSLSNYNWNQKPDFEDLKWIDEDITQIKVKDNVNKNAGANVLKSGVIEFKENSAPTYNKNDKIKSNIFILNTNKTNISDKKKHINEVFNNSNKIRRIYLTSSEKPVSHNIDDVFKDKVIEVMDLSDLGYDDTDDIVTISNHVKDIKKHVSSNIPFLNDKPKQIMQQPDTKNTQHEKRLESPVEKSNEKGKPKIKRKNTEHRTESSTKRTINTFNYDNTTTGKPQINRMSLISTTSITTPASDTTYSIGIVTATKPILKKEHDKSSIIKMLPNKAKIERVQFLTSTKATPHEKPKIKTDVNNGGTKERIKSDNMLEQRANKTTQTDKKAAITPIKPVTVTSTANKYQKLLFKPVIKPVLPSPDDIMINELLIEDKIVKKNNTTIVISTTETVDPVATNVFSKKVQVNKKHLSTTTENVQLDEVMKVQIELNKPEDVNADNFDVNNDENDKFEDVIYSTFNTDLDKSDQIPITINAPIKTTFETEPTRNYAQDDATEAYVETYEHHNYPPILIESKPEFITKTETFVDDKKTATNSTVVKNKQTTSRNNENKNKNKNEHTNDKDSITKPTLDNVKEKKYEQSEAHVKESESKNKVPNSLENLVRFLKVVTETISRNARRSLKGKTHYLEDLRDTIMANIEQRIEAEFPDDAPRRSTREARGHVEFPSSESALMTISFLTFAVFLIKLVLQLIYAYKYKTMLMPAVVATVGRAYSNFKGQP